MYLSLIATNWQKNERMSTCYFSERKLCSQSSIISNLNDALSGFSENLAAKLNLGNINRNL